MHANENRHRPSLVLLATVIVATLAVRGALARQPRLDTLEPDSGSPTASTAVTLSGSGFAEDMQVALVEGGIVDLGPEDSVAKLDHRGDLFYGARENTLVLLQLEPDGRLIEIARLTLEGEITAMDLDQDLALVAVFDWENWRSFLVVIDASDPGSPTAVGRLEIPSSIYLISLAIDGSTAVWSEFDGYHFVDLTDPAYPIERSRIETRPGFTDFTLEGGFLYGGGFSTGLLVIDHRDLDAPQIVYSSRSYMPWRKIQVSRERLYLYSYPQGLVIFDISDPATPDLLGGFPAGVSRFDVDDVDGHRLVARLASRTALFDVSDPAALVEIEAIGGSLHHPDTLILHGPWIIEGLYSLRHRIDARRVERPAPLFHFQDRSTIRRSMAASDDRLYVGVKEGVEIWRLDGPRGPERIGRIDEAGDPNDLAVGQGLLYALSGRSPGLTVFDLSNPEAPTAVAQIPNLTGVRLVVRGSWLYIVQDRALLIVDAADPLHPVEVGRIPARSAWGNYVIFDDVCLDGSDAYIVSSTNGLFKADIGNPEAPEMVWETPQVLGQFPHRCAIVGNHLYVGSLSTVAVLEKGSRRADAWLRPVHATRDMTAVGDQLYISDSLGLKVFDTSLDPLHASLRSATDLPGSVQIGAVALDPSRALSVGWFDLAVVRTNPALEDVLRISDGRMEFTVPPGMNVGTYHVLAHQFHSGLHYLGNAFEVTETCSLEASLGSDLDPLSGKVSLPGSWVLHAEGDERFFDPERRHHAWLAWPPLGEAPIVETVASDSAEEVIEIHRGPTTEAWVRLIGPDPASLAERWETMVAQGGISLAPDGLHDYRPLELNLRRERSGGLAVVDPAGRPQGGAGSTVYRYTLRDGVLVAATARGPQADHRFHLAGTTAGGCEAEEVLSVFDEAVAACRAFNDENPSWKIDCPGP
ncbi:MAG: hypothetical protein Q9Q40_12650 [Acidobacteriota bacterium]|nr:hypothetical protein [Acidobacteriota bacterium]